MKTRLPLLLVLLLLAAPAIGQDRLAAAQALYSAAQYDEALKAFDSLKALPNATPKTLVALEQGRAFCLLALDRRQEAEAAFEAIVGADPFYKLPDDDAPPKIRTAFRDVRRRMLPGLLQQTYDRSKSAYDRKAYDEAVTGFGLVLSLLEDPDLVLEAGPRGDMRLIARAFTDLSKVAAVPAAPGPPANNPPAAADGVPADAGKPPSSPGAGTTAGGTPPKGTSAAPLYDASAKDVTAPVPVRTDVLVPLSMRRALPPGEAIVEVVISETGRVETATTRQAANPVVGALASSAALDWRYKPATKAGKPVRYRLMAKVVITP
jgi:hypothetical protein